MPIYDCEYIPSPLLKIKFLHLPRCVNIRFVRAFFAWIFANSVSSSPVMTESIWLPTTPAITEYLLLDLLSTFFLNLSFFFFLSNFSCFSCFCIHSFPSNDIRGGGFPKLTISASFPWSFTDNFWQQPLLKVPTKRSFFKGIVSQD